MRALVFTTSACLLLSACGGGGSSPSVASGTPVPVVTPTPAPTLSQVFATALVGAGDPGSKYLKACYFPTQQFGTVGQSGISFLESLVLETLPSATAPVYNALNGNTTLVTNRSYKGSSPVAGAPATLWTGVFKLNADGSASGFGYPCTPDTMITAPTTTCYWLEEDVNGKSLAQGSFVAVGNARPQTSSGSNVLINPGWDSGTAFYFWYEMSYGGSCSAPGSTTVWRGPARAGV